MRAHLSFLFVTSLMCFVLFGCSKPPATSTATSQATDNMATSPTTTNAMAPAPATAAPAPEPMAAKPVEPPPPPLVVPSGTTISVRMGETVSAKTAQVGQTFTGTVATPVSVGGKTAIPAGSSASGTVVGAKGQGRFKGEGSLSLSLTSVAGYSVNTSDYTAIVKGKGKRTAAMVGGGAGGGALIGGIAGGGKGAAIGALVGAGAGTAGSAFTGNKDVTVPAESVVSFKLSSPVTIKK